MPDAVAAAPPADLLDQPLPAELAGSNQGWFTQYRRYPVFSRPWARGRLRAWTLAIGAWCAFMVLNLEAVPGPPGALAMAWVSIVLATAFWFGLPMLLGPALGGWVRRRGFAPRTEIVALVLAVAAAVVATKVADPLLRMPIKQWLNDRIVGPDQPLVVVMIGGVRVEQVLRPTRPDAAAYKPAQPPAAGASAPWAPPEASPFVEGVIASIWVVLMALWGGALGVPGVQRERSGLAAWRARRQAAEADAARREADHARREAELRLAVLQAQVEPHFLFNTLAGVRSAIAADPARAALMIDRLVDYLRTTVPRLRGAPAEAAAEATLGGQFDSARAYLALMQLRMPRLAFEVDIDAALRDVPCAPLLLITLVENAVKHGVEPKVGPAQVTVRAMPLAAGDGRAEPGVRIDVCDDGVGFGAEGGHGLGLINLRQRLAALYGSRARFELRGRPEGGVCAQLELPCSADGAAPVAESKGQP